MLTCAVSVCHFSKNKKLFADAPFLYGPSARPYPLPSSQFAFGHTARMVFACGSCGQCGQPVASRMAMQDVDNMDNLFCIVHIVHFSFAPVFFFLRGNSRLVNLWTRWTMWTPFLNWCRMRCQPYVTHPYINISTSNFYLLFIIHIVHNTSQTAPLLALRVDNQPPKPSPLDVQRLSTKPRESPM